ncbi:unnamed protein product [Pleuronectes platessa]|uniref:Uncharacterized protein n=1 Tax=Pleuronectes platessa TaxID=8262 RepID=A0A9N7Y207_PLEPL|nr:unnamed protein product [Pleuronectes platessa]
MMEEGARRCITADTVCSAAPPLALAQLRSSTVKAVFRKEAGSRRGPVRPLKQQCVAVGLETACSHCHNRKGILPGKTGSATSPPTEPSQASPSLGVGESGCSLSGPCKAEVCLRRCSPHLV